MKTNRMRHRCEARGGFTLLEVLIVLLIIGVIAAMVVPNLLGQQRVAYIRATKANIKSFEQALEFYAYNHDAEFPDGGQEVIDLLMSNTDDEGELIDPLLSKLPKDAWGNLLFYEYPNTKFATTKPAIWSAGPNKRDEQGGGDDVTNWEELEKDQQY